eukprot:COSAG01_NODE_4405_length_5058_cov_2.083266_2_plen_209_part_00
MVLARVPAPPARRGRPATHRSASSAACSTRSIAPPAAPRWRCSHVTDCCAREPDSRRVRLASCCATAPASSHTVRSAASMRPRSAVDTAPGSSSMLVLLLVSLLWVLGAAGIGGVRASVGGQDVGSAVGSCSCSCSSNVVSRHSIAAAARRAPGWLLVAPRRHRGLLHHALCCIGGGWGRCLLLQDIGVTIQQFGSTTGTNLSVRRIL